MGNAPPNVVQNYLNRWCGVNKWTFNVHRLQSIVSRFCRHFCIYFCVLRNNGITIREIVASLSEDTAFNDLLVLAFVCVVVNSNVTCQ